MRFIILFILILTMLGCSFVPLYSIDDNDAIWIHKKTKKEPESYLVQQCNKNAEMIVLGRYDNDEGSKEYYDNWSRILEQEGKCLYENGYVFYVKPFSPYCYRLQEICDSYKKYRVYTLF